MCNSNRSCGCSLANAINNLFNTSSWFNNGGCGCNNYDRGFVNGVNTVNNILNGNNGGCGCNGGNNGCGCGSNADLSAYTACNDQCYDPYYAAQYGYPTGCSCSASAYNNLF